MISFKILSKIKQKFAGSPVSELRDGEGTLLPTTLNLMVTDACNSRCVMCNVWDSKQEKEFTPSELSEILKDPLFENLKSIGVSGGEPTLRRDLPELFQVLAGKKGIRGISLITNALNESAAISQLDRCNGICKEAGVSFSVMVSLDGIGSVHDSVRGRKGS